MERRRQEPYLINPIESMLNPWETIYYPSRGKKVRRWRTPTGQFGKPPRGQELEIQNPYELIHYPAHSTYLWREPTGRFGVAPAGAEIPTIIEKVKPTKKTRKARKTRKQEPLEELMLINPMEEIMIANPRKDRRIKRIRRIRKNPVDVKGFLPMLQSSAMMFVGYAGSNFLFNQLGSKVPVLATPLVKAIAKMGVAMILPARMKNIAYGFAMSSLRDFVAVVSPQLAGQLASTEAYLPEPKTIEQYLPEPEKVESYVEENLTAEPKEIEEF